jgi:hypothetical protein
MQFVLSLGGVGFQLLDRQGVDDPDQWDVAIRGSGFYRSHWPKYFGSIRSGQSQKYLAQGKIER